MPGTTPSDAVRLFVAPLQQALGCVAHGKISVRRGGYRPQLGAEQQWSLNDGGGVALRRQAGSPWSPLELYAAMYWRVIEDEREGYGPFRVTTIGYDYSLVANEKDELWAMHWHAQSQSQEIKPHLHLGDLLLSDQSPVTSHNHLRTGRMTFETAIRWAVEFGARPLHDDWETRLALAEAPHLLYRSWGADPDIKQPTSD